MQTIQVSQIANIFKSYTTLHMRYAFILGFASGLPLALTDTLLQAWCTVAGVDLVTIGMLSLIGQPYVLKWLWAPLLDAFPLGGLGLWRVAWIRVLQIILIFLIAGMAFMHPLSFWPMVILAVLIATISATQDIAIDAYRTEFLTTEERGPGVAIAVGGYRVAMLVSGGFALILAHRLGFPASYGIMAGIMACTMLLCWRLPKVKPPYHVLPKGVRQWSQPLKAWVLPWLEFIKRPQALLLLLLITLYKLGDGFVGSLTTAFLIRSLHFSLEEIGIATKIVGLVSTLIGVFCAGYLLKKMGTYRALFWFGLLQAITNLGYSWLAMVEPHFYQMACVVFLEHLTSGMGTAALVAFLMSLCDKRYTAAQFALFSALTAVSRVMVSALSGWMVESMGWKTFFFSTFWIGLLPLVILWQLREARCFKGTEGCA